MTHRGPFQPLLFCDSAGNAPIARGAHAVGQRSVLSGG